MHRSILLLASLALVAAGCGGAEAVQHDSYALSESALYGHLDRLVGSEPDSAQAARRAGYAAGQMRAAGLMPVFASSFFLAGVAGADDPGRAHVLGYVPGRHPSYADTLVVVAADRDSPGAAAALETARRLALEALDVQVPARTVLFALWAPPRSGARGVADYLARPTWGIDQIARVLLVSSDSAAVAESRAVLDAHGVAAEQVSIPPTSAQADRPGAKRERLRSETLRLAEILHRRTRVVSAGASPDATLRPPEPTRR